MRIPTILIIEHDTNIRNMYRYALLRKKHQILEAMDRISALEIAQKHRLDLILQGLVLPETDNSQLNHQLQQTTKNTNVVIIALSSFLHHVAHEINNPIAEILSHLNDLKHGLDQIKNNKNGWDKDLQAPLNNLEKSLLESIHGAEQIRKIILPFEQEKSILKPTPTPQQGHEVQNDVKDKVTLHSKKLTRSKKTQPLAHHDALTELPNRYSFYEALEQRIVKAHQTSEQFALITFDINQFIQINTLFGHQKADLLLQRLAKRLKKLMAEEHDVGRMGNDEFALIIKLTKDSTPLTSLINRLFKVIKKPTSIHGERFRLTASIGVSIYPLHGDNPDLLIQRVNLALECSKKSGVDNFQVYQSEMEDNNKKQPFIIDDIYQAIGNKQFIVHYQPIYNIDTHKIEGLEALIRWQHPQQGLLLPKNFLNFCEETRLIIPIGAGVLRAACQQVKLWHDMGLTDLTLAVNISVHQMNHPLFLDLIIDVLDSTQLPPSALILEITESLLIQNTEKISNLLNTLRVIGLKLSLDDFGTGYSSLSYLRQFPFSSLKIDRSFIKSMTSTAAAEAIVDTIISLGKILNLKIIAEGVETNEQLHLLQKKQCDFLQGFLLSKPLAAYDIEQLLMKQNKF